MNFVLQNFRYNIVSSKWRLTCRKSCFIPLFAVVPLLFTQIIDLRILLAHFTDRIILPPFIAIFSGNLKEITPFPTHIMIFLEIAQSTICRLERTWLISVSVLQITRLAYLAVAWKRPWWQCIIQCYIFFTKNCI